MAERQPPRFTGVNTYIDPYGRFHFRHSWEWEQFELDDNRDGVMFVPDTKDMNTWFAVWITELKDQHVVAEDLDILREGLEEGLKQLEDCKVEQSSEDVMGNLIKFERIFTFKENGQTRKRKQWVLYVDRWMMVVIFQGSTEEEYKYWLAMANYSFATFNLPEELWFMTDRDLAGYWKEYTKK